MQAEGMGKGKSNATSVSLCNIQEACSPRKHSKEGVWIHFSEQKFKLITLDVLPEIQCLIDEKPSKGV